MRLIILLLSLMLALPTASSGEGIDVPVDAFIERTGIDDALREKVGDFLRKKGITARTLNMIDDARLSRYAQHLANDLPISYDDLLDAPSQPLPEGAQITCLAALMPQGAAMESLLTDFENHVIYYDETWPVPRDVCRAACAGPLSEGDALRLMDLLKSLPLEDGPVDIKGVELGAVRLAVQWEGGVTRLTGTSEQFIDTVRALLGAGRAAAQGEDSCD